MLQAKAKQKFGVSLVDAGNDNFFFKSSVWKASSTLDWQGKFISNVSNKILTFQIHEYKYPGRIFPHICLKNHGKIHPQLMNIRTLVEYFSIRCMKKPLVVWKIKETLISISMVFSDTFADGGNWTFSRFCFLYSAKKCIIMRMKHLSRAHIHIRHRVGKRSPVIE